MLRRAVATRGRVLLVAVCLAAPLACKSSDNPAPSTSDAGEPGDEPGAGGTDAAGGGTSSGGKNNGGTTSLVGGEPGLDAGGAPTEPGSWDEATWDEALWQ